MQFAVLYTSIQGASALGLIAVVVYLHRIVSRADTLARRLRPLDAVADRLGELAAPGQHAADLAVPDTPPDGMHARRRYAPTLVGAASPALHDDDHPGTRRSPVVQKPTSVAPADEHGRRPSSVLSSFSRPDTTTRRL